MAAADAVILPQGCRCALNRLARRHCPRVFPNYDARFSYPGKTGQIRLFRKLGVPHPETRLFSDTATLAVSCAKRLPLAFPVVFKLDWGGEGDGVHRFKDPGMLLRWLETTRFQPPAPCLVQEYVPHRQRTLRVVVVGTALVSYWKSVQKPGRFGASLARGAVIDALADPDLQAVGKEAVKEFCQTSGINLAGFDLIFPETPDYCKPLFLEINYFFGRRGLGGSERFYEMLEKEISSWLTRAR